MFSQGVGVFKIGDDEGGITTCHTVLEEGARGLDEIRHLVVDQRVMIQQGAGRTARAEEVLDGDPQGRG
jgi:hypothetical protein